MIEWLKKVFSKILNSDIKLHNNNLGLVNANADIKADVKLSATMNTQFGNTYQDNRNVTIVQGITYEDMQVCVNTVINEKIALLKADLEEKLLPEQLNQLKDNVGVIASYREVISISAIKNDKDFDQILSDTLKDRIESDDTDYQNTCAQAISVIGKFTKNHLKLLALFYIYRSEYLKNFTSIEQFIDFYNQYMVQLVDIPLDNIMNIGLPIIANGCAVTYTFGSSFSDFFNKDVQEAIKELLSGKPLTEEEQKQKNVIDKLTKVWDDSRLASAFPTPVGKCIGNKYLKDILFFNLNDPKNDSITPSSPSKVTYGDIGRIYKPE